ncbi:class II glutamine amidotransferase [Sulfitobacter mediterraneus]|uniref:class II glutamine amidotransferase n=1 Tax=Sulfitobacter mediterraneus TaxID=83219 RepID=UPI00193ABA18|nr:class II glutamine amidotransferase [Sulfitobacter mediterraneus]MBM1556542.1 class II glutamine amidotransferase [Sulfitobacter mediterraneus]MBM1569648.1 class II glutamine amidotransferase [Sulfitobacter mediterraneus]MBM1573605.1 class II glutamine amidotransferase [Sulfitobacter mediterraneus]MBM1577394.1 class II glutamine amidotransferase [Sulfitobacter mediterraneus]MBM1579500.1 class II glutamine amidotransferase [Sulfitobacter mediterraneus]
MCRWAAWQGKPLFLSEILTAPDHSLIQQSREASKCKTAINADGFGLAWYDQHPNPGLYRDVYPAWSDANLRSLAEQVRARLFLAHVRASTGTATSRNNCHPFVQGKWSFMHNGQVGGFDSFRKDADMMIPNALYANRKGATDSEALFLVACGMGLDRDPKAAMQAAVGAFEARSVQSGQGPHMRMAAGFSDGETLYALRYASDDLAPSMFYQWNEDWQGWSVVSEPYDTALGNWIEVPKGSFCRFTATEVEIEPFAPNFMQAKEPELLAV